MNASASLKKQLAGMNREALGLLKPYFWKYRWNIIIGLLALIAVDACQLLIPRAMKLAIDGIADASINSQGLLFYAGIILGLALGVAVFRFVWRYYILGFSRKLERDIRNLLFSHLLTLDRSFYHRKTTGELMALSSNDLISVQLFCGMGLIATVDATVIIIAALGFMIYIHPQLTLYSILPLPLLAILTRLLSGRLHQYFRKVQEQFSTLTEYARSTIQSIRLIKVYTKESYQVAGFDKLGREYIKDNLKVATIQGVLFPVSGFIANISLFIIIFFGGRLTINNSITIGDFVAFISYLYMLTWPMMAIGWVINLFQRGMTSMNRIQQVLEVSPNLESGSKTLNGDERVNYRISSLFFTYPNTTQEVLHDINLDIRPGLTGIMGKTGSGKSTLCHLLARYYPIPGHSILVNDNDINELRLESYRRLVCYVPQDSFLFSSSIAQNIAFSDPDAPMEKIIQAAKAAAIHDEIENLPEGYGSRIGEKGVKLSGGQRQRISLARALFAGSPVLIIDDGLSAVDADTEHEILANLSGYYQDRTIIFASHRVGPLRHAQQIAVLENGRIAHKGTHQELLEADEYYRTIFSHQTGQKNEVSRNGS